MERQKLLNLIRCLREEIATLCIVKCRMSHEQVVRDQWSGLPVACRFPEGSYQRVGLCTPALRALRLGCSHTSARIKLDDAIKVLALGDVENHRTSTGLSRELARLNNAIHLLDHRKGDAEKRLARMLDEVHAAKASTDRCEEVREVEDEVCRMEELHDGYVERVGRLRDRVIREMDRLLAEDSLLREASESEAV